MRRWRCGHRKSMRFAFYSGGVASRGVLPTCSAPPHEGRRRHVRRERRDALSDTHKGNLTQAARETEKNARFGLAAHGHLLVAAGVARARVRTQPHIIPCCSWPAAHRAPARPHLRVGIEITERSLTHSKHHATPASRPRRPASAPNARRPHPIPHPLCPWLLSIDSECIPAICVAVPPPSSTCHSCAVGVDAPMCPQHRRCSPPPRPPLRLLTPPHASTRLLTPPHASSRLTLTSADASTYAVRRA